MSKRNLGLLIAGAVMASAFAHGASAQSPSARMSEEPVLAFRATGDGLRFRVQTGGCTSAQNFQLGVQRSSGQAQLTLTRVVPDSCKGDFPEGTEITFSYDAAGIDRADAIQLMNRLVTYGPQPQ
jgi:hypothetical protein